MYFSNMRGHSRCIKFRDNISRFRCFTDNDSNDS